MQNCKDNKEPKIICSKCKAEYNRLVSMHCLRCGAPLYNVSCSNCRGECSK